MLYEVRSILFPRIIADVKELREESVQLLWPLEKAKKQNSAQNIYFLALLYGVQDFLRDALLHSTKCRDAQSVCGTGRRKNVPLAVHWQDGPLLGTALALLLSNWLPKQCISVSINEHSALSPDSELNSTVWPVTTCSLWIPLSSST